MTFLGLHQLGVGVGWGDVGRGGVKTGTEEKGGMGREGRVSKASVQECGDLGSMWHEDLLKCTGMWGPGQYVA